MLLDAVTVLLVLVRLVVMVTSLTVILQHALFVLQDARCAVHQILTLVLHASMELIYLEQNVCLVILSALLVMSQPIAVKVVCQVSILLEHVINALKTV